MLKKKHHKKRIFNKKKQTKNKNKNKNKNIIKVNVNTSTSGGSGGSTIPYSIYPISQQMFPANTPPNIYNVFTKDPVTSTYEPQTELRQFTIPRRIPTQDNLVQRDDGITFSENDEGRSINFDNETAPNLTSQLVDRRTPSRIREQIRETLGESYEEEEQDYRELLKKKGLSNQSIGQYIRRFREKYNKK